jgi:hypothetical protein
MLGVALWICGLVLLLLWMILLKYVWMLMLLLRLFECWCHMIAFGSCQSKLPYVLISFVWHELHNRYKH